MTMLTPGEVIRMINAQADALFAGFGQLGLIQVQGVLGPLRDSRYPTYYGIELRDNAGSSLMLDIPKNLKPEGLTGREVEISGFLQAKKRLEYSVQVSQIRPVEAVSQEVLQEEKSLRAVFQRPNMGSDTFPDINGSLVISYIHGANSAVRNDFENQVRDIEGIRFDPVLASLQESDAIADAIRRARGSVVIILRGGGNEGDFEVFNRPSVLEAWRMKAAYKVAALGHTKDTTLLDRFSHHVCDTPTAAGKWIRDCIQNQYERLYWRERAEGSDKNLAVALQANNQDWSQKLESFSTQLARLQERNRVLEQERLTLSQDLQNAKNAKGRQIPPWIWVLIGTGIVLGFILGWLFGLFRA
jgi:hypothetical protein